MQPYLFSFGPIDVGSNDYVNGLFKSEYLYQVSLWAQVFFTFNTGDHILRVESDKEQGPVYWSGNLEGANRLLKLANYQNRDARLNILCAFMQGS